MCVCVCVCVCVCECVSVCSLRAGIFLDLCLFGSRKCACAGGVRDVREGWEECRVAERSEGRVGGEKNGRIK